MAVAVDAPRRDVALPGETLVKQGAEALAFRSAFLADLPALRKHRPRKLYRHATLDAKLTRHRILSEARILQRARRAGVPVPAVYGVDVERGDLWIEFIDGPSVRDVLLAPVADVGAAAAAAPREAADRDMMAAVGRVVSRLHDNDIIHGDLTTSNLLYRDERATRSARDRVVLIDFGLGQVSAHGEDKAVDLYVLERAFLSTHPSSTELFELVLSAYRDEGGRRAADVLKRLETVRMRGRKRTMVG